MKRRRTLHLCFFLSLVFGVGCSIIGGHQPPGPISKGIRSDHPYRLGKECQLQHEGYLEKAIEYYQKALEDPQAADRARFELGLLFYEKGEFARAIEHLKRLRNDGQDEFVVSKILGLSHFRLHQHPEALHHLKRAHTLNPKNGEVIYTLGLVYEAENCAEEAKECFRRVLSVSGGSRWEEQAKSHLDILQNGDAGTTVSQIENDEVRGLISKAPDQVAHPDAGAIVLLDEERLTIHPDRSQTREIHKVIKILNERGKYRAEVKISYDSLDERVHVDLARTIRPDGKIVNVGREAMRDLTPWGGFPLYSNSKVRVISMPEVEDGAVIEYKATIVASKLPFGEYFTDHFGFQDFEPTVIARYILEVPEGLRFKNHFLHTDPIEPQVEHLNGSGKHDDDSAGAESTDLRPRKEPSVRYTWEIKDLPAIKWERSMPGWVDIAPMILVSSFPDWDVFNRWWEELARDRIETDRALRKKVRELTRNGRTPEERARAIFHYVASEIRYVGLEYGKGGYRPHHAREVFANKYGDCKDQSILLVAMLREAGVRAHPVLIGTRRGTWELQRVIPMPQFDHCIAMAEIDGKEIWLDPTDETCSFGDIPGGNQGREVLVFFEDGARFLRTPVLPPEKNKHTSEMEIRITAHGDMYVKGKDTFRGCPGRRIRNSLKWRDSRERVDFMRELISGDCPGAALENCTFSGLEDLNEPAAIEYEVSAPDYPKRAGDLLLFNLPWISNGTDHVAKEERTHPLRWNNTYLSKERISVLIPTGYRVRYLPEGVDIDLPFASYRLEYENSGRRITVKTREIRNIRSIEVDQYPEYKRCEERYAKELEKLIILERIEGSDHENAVTTSLPTS